MLETLPIPLVFPAGRENIAKAEACRAIIVFNHVSYVDAAVLGGVFAPSGVVKASLAHMPLFGVSPAGKVANPGASAWL